MGDREAVCQPLVNTIIFNFPLNKHGKRKVRTTCFSYLQYGSDHIIFIHSSYSSLQNIGRSSNFIFYFFCEFSRDSSLWAQILTVSLENRLIRFEQRIRRAFHHPIFSNQLKIIWWVRFGRFWLYKSRLGLTVLVMLGLAQILIQYSNLDHYFDFLSVELVIEHNKFWI
jgi:hypothetical protein